MMRGSRRVSAACGAVLFLLMSLTSCSADADTQPEWARGKSRYGDLPAVIGDVSAPSKPPFDLPVNVNEGLAQRSEYGERTNRRFATGFAISTGKRLPGDEVSIQLQAVSSDRKIRYQLTERNASLERIGLLKEEVSVNHRFSAILPDREGALYLLSAEALGEDDEVQDTLLALVEVPIQAMNAKLYTDQEEYAPDGTVILHLENDGPTDLQFGKDYRLEQYGDGKWVSLELGVAVDSIGISLAPGKVYRQEIRLPGLPDGAYRIVKRFGAEGTRLSAVLAARFEVVR